MILHLYFIKRQHMYFTVNCNRLLSQTLGEIYASYHINVFCIFILSDFVYVTNNQNLTF